MRYAARIVRERKTAAEQCTRILPAPLWDASAASMGEEEESARESRWYEMLGKVFARVAPMLRM
jgi:hypothetical protein